jgi:hypothetical protein
MGHKLRGLAHVELNDGIGQAAFEADDGLKKRRSNLEQRHELRPRIASPIEARIPLHRAAAENERRMAERFRPTCENKIGHAVLDITIAGVDRLHARAAIDLHCEGGHALTHAKPQGCDAGRIHLIRDDVDATQNDLVERVGSKRLTQQKRPAALQERSTGVNGPGFPRAFMKGVRLPSII